MSKYDDIINMPHHTSPTRRPMPIGDRAAQFAPFAALTGHDAAVKETARLTQRRIELDETAKALLDEKLQILMDLSPEQREIIITYFIPDERKNGGSYVVRSGLVKKIDSYNHQILLSDGTAVAIDEICDIDSEHFTAFDFE